jgi:hypothetical protein
LIQVGVPVAGRNDVSPDHRPGSSTVHSPEIGSYDDNVFPYESGDPEDNAGLTTGASAPLNAETFRTGYTIDTFVRMPLDWDA